MYTKICTQFDKIGFCCFLIKKDCGNTTIFEFIKFENVKDAILFYDENKEVIIPDYVTLKRFGLL